MQVLDLMELSSYQYLDKKRLDKEVVSSYFYFYEMDPVNLKSDYFSLTKIFDDRRNFLNPRFRTKNKSKEKDLVSLKIDDFTCQKQ